MKRNESKIVLITLGVHSLFLFAFPSSTHLKEPPKKKHELRIVTKEITPPKTLPVKFVQSSSPPSSVMTQKEQTDPIKPQLPKKISSPPKKAPVKKIIKNKTTKPPVKSVKSVRGKFEKNVAKIQKKSPSSSINTSPKATLIQTSPIAPTDVEQGEEKYNYLSTVSSQLQEWLVLPEKGIVKLTITVQPNGKIVNIKPLSTESEKNLEYLKHILETLQLPVYEKNEEITFTIMFCDEK